MEERKLENLIIRELETREEMLACMQEWDEEANAADSGKTNHGKIMLKRWIFGGTTAACIVAAIAMLLPVLDHIYSPGQPASHVMPEFETTYSRGDNDLASIDQLINVREYPEALEKCDAELQASKEELQNLSADLPEEERTYLSGELRQRVYELEWRKINLLLSLGRETEGRNLLKTFSETPGVYQEEARNLESYN